MANPLLPTPALLCKLGSILVHAEEMTSPHSHPVDQATFLQPAVDPEVVEWRTQMIKMGLLPVKRN